LVHRESKQLYGFSQILPMDLSRGVRQTVKTQVTGR
jgi:hypothetical protein